MVVDHINGNGLDNRRSNLRVCTRSENGMNRGKNKNNKSGYKGVAWHEKAKLWRATLGLKGKIIHLGDFADKSEAYRAYVEACKKYHKEFARY